MTQRFQACVGVAVIISEADKRSPGGGLTLEVGFSSEHVDCKGFMSHQVVGGTYQAIGARSKQEGDLEVFCPELALKVTRSNESKRRNNLGHKLISFW